MTKFNANRTDVRAILDSQHPLDLLLETCSSGRSAFIEKWGNRDACLGSATDFVTVLLAELLSSNPLLITNYTCMTWREDGGGNLVRRKDGSYWLSIPAGKFRSHKKYEAMVAPEWCEDPDLYLGKYRPFLLQRNEEGTDYLFPGQGGKSCNAGALSKKLRDFTSRHCPVVTQGFDSHGCRDIIAMDYLKKNPNGFQVVAAILHASLETVRRVYAHLQMTRSPGYDPNATAFSAYSRYLSERVRMVQCGDR